MKKTDLYCLFAVILFFLPFFLFDKVYQTYYQLNTQYPYPVSFLKFAVLATFGEMLGMRIKTGKYYPAGFGLIPRAIVWGFLGMMIKMNFVIFGAAAPRLLSSIGIPTPDHILTTAFSLHKLLTAFTVSITLNAFFAPILMTLHKITDSHIELTGGTIKGFFTPIHVRQILENVEWRSLWGFVIKKTIPFFWVPAQTINFLLPEEYRVLVAALYSVILGIILAVASLKEY